MEGNSCRWRAGHTSLERLLKLSWVPGLSGSAGAAGIYGRNEAMEFNHLKQVAGRTGPIVDPAMRGRDRKSVNNVFDENRKSLVSRFSQGKDRL